MVRQWQQLFHEKRYSFVDITSPDFVQVAKGIWYCRHNSFKERRIEECY